MSSAVGTSLVGKRWRENNTGNFNNEEKESAIDLFEVKKEKNINSDAYKFQTNSREDNSIKNLQSSMGNWLKTTDNKKKNKKKDKRKGNLDNENEDNIQNNKNVITYNYNENEDYYYPDENGI